VFELVTEGSVEAIEPTTPASCSPVTLWVSEGSVAAVLALAIALPVEDWLNDGSVDATLAVRICV
jgi:hypothetical protein